VTAATTCLGQFTSSGPDCQAEESRLHLGARFNYFGAAPNQTVVRIEWKKDGLLLGQWSVNTQYATGYVWQNYTSPTELASGTYEAVLYSEGLERGRAQLVLPFSAAELQMKRQAASQEIASARQLFETREYSAAVAACDRAISIDPDNAQDATQLREQIARTMNILESQPATSEPPQQAVIVNPSARPSFDCNRATTPSERLICSDQDLASLEVQMVGAFKDALSRLPDSDQAKLRGEHLQWFKSYARTCNAAAGDPAELRHCVERFLSERRDYLRSR